jgi:gas vesicle protein
MRLDRAFLGLLAGIATGAVIGILFAPDAGSKTRKKIYDKGEGYADALMDKFDELMNTVTNKYEDVRDDADDYVAKGKNKYDEIKNKYEDVKKELKTEYKEVKNDFKNATA